MSLAPPPPAPFRSNLAIGSAPPPPLKPPNASVITDARVACRSPPIPPTFIKIVVPGITFKVAVTIAPKPNQHSYLYITFQ